MNKKTQTSAIRVFSLLLVVAGTAAWSQERRPTHLSGLINDYSPATVKGGPWEMHGQWSMDLHPDWGTADFSADMTMSGYGKTAEDAVDPTKAGQLPHTHHIRLKNVMITWDMIGCPTVTPPTTKGFQINGTVDLLSGNGGPAPFETVPPSSTLQVCVTGGTEVSHSNVSLVFGAPAASHFGPQAIHGVVRKASAEWGWLTNALAQ
jgi:hypothetical protein